MDGIRLKSSTPNAPGPTELFLEAILELAVENMTHSSVTCQKAFWRRLGSTFRDQIHLFHIQGSGQIAHLLSDFGILDVLGIHLCDFKTTLANVDHNDDGVSDDLESFFS